LNDLGGAVAVVAVDRLLDKVGHGTPHTDRWIIAAENDVGRACSQLKC
jgi:hypothetical protein